MSKEKECPADKSKEKPKDTSKKKSSPLSSISKSLKVPKLKGFPKLKGLPSIKGFDPKTFINQLINTFLVGKSGGSGGPVDMGDSGKAAALGRPMKYPYTLGAKLAQFPYKFMINNCWPYKYYILGVIVTLPLFYKIGKASHSPENVANWEKIRKEILTPHGHH